MCGCKICEHCSQSIPDRNELLFKVGIHDILWGKPAHLLSRRQITGIEGLPLSFGPTVYMAQSRSKESLLLQAAQTSSLSLEVHANEVQSIEFVHKYSNVCIA